MLNNTATDGVIAFAEPVFEGMTGPEEARFNVARVFVPAET
jgi:hypothetical protein